MVATAGRAERERERLRKLEVKRKEQRWLNPSAAQLQREHEYMDWVLTRPEQFGDEPRNDTFEIFLAERSFAKEKERLRLRAEQRKRERQEKRRLADAAKPAPAPAPARHVPAPARPAAAPRTPQPRGRPVDPNSKRQRLLVERREREEECRKLNEMLNKMTPAERGLWDEEQYELEVAQALQRSPHAEIVAGRQERCRALLAAVPQEQRAEAERLFWKHVELSNAAAVASEQSRLRYRRHSRPAYTHALARERETSVAARVLIKELRALPGIENWPWRRNSIILWFLQARGFSWMNGG